MSDLLTVKEARQAAGTYLDIVQVEARLSMLGNGAAISYWNGTYDINLLEPGLTNSSRRVLASGNNIDAGLFERATARLKELRAPVVNPHVVHYPIHIEAWD